MIKSKRWLMRSQRDVVLDEYDFDDEDLKPDEVIIRADFTAVSPGTECANYQALDPDVYREDSWCPYPWHAGYAGAGHVLATGEEVTQFNPGDHVVAALTHGTHWRGNLNSLIGPANPSIPLEHAAYTPIVSICITALQVLRNDHLDPYPLAGVWGQGVIGNLTAQVLQCAGYRTFGIDPVEQRRELASDCGIRETLDPSSDSFREQVEELTGGRGFDVAVDTTGQAAITIGIPEHVRMRGEMVLMTHWRSQPLVDASPFIHKVFWDGITVYGAHMRTPGREPWSDWTEVQRRKWAKIQYQMSVGQIVVEPLISHRVQPGQCKDTYEGLCFDRSKWWGAVVDWRS